MKKFTCNMSVFFTVFILMTAAGCDDGGDGHASGSSTSITDLSVSAGSEEVTLTWEGDVTSVILYGIIDEFSEKFSAMGTQPLTITGLLNGKTYVFNVKSLDDRGMVLDEFYVTAIPKIAGAPDSAVYIYDADGLDSIRNDLGGYYVIMRDIDLEGVSWTPCGDISNNFTGTLDGNGHCIKNIAFSDSTLSYVGLLFYIIGQEGTVCNLCINGGSLEGNHYIGLIAGANDGTISNCSVTGTVVPLYNGADTNTSIGGLVGKNYNATIDNCYAAVTIDPEFAVCVGGLVGSNDGGIIRNCYATGAVSGFNQVGGLVGGSWNGTISNCYITGAITSTLGNRGGLLGMNSFTTVTDSFWDTETSGQATSQGGTGKTTAEMKNVATFTDTATEGLSTAWDFVNNPNNDTATEDIWSIDTTQTINGGYPYLTNNLPQ